MYRIVYQTDNELSSMELFTTKDLLHEYITITYSLDYHSVRLYNNNKDITEKVNKIIYREIK